jgi:hypothetical protein
MRDLLIIGVSQRRGGRAHVIRKGGSRTWNKSSMLSSKRCKAYDKKCAALLLL